MPVALGVHDFILPLTQAWYLSTKPRDASKTHRTVVVGFQAKSRRKVRDDYTAEKAVLRRFPTKQ